MKTLKICATFVILFLLFSCEKEKFKLNENLGISFGKSIEVELSGSEKMTLEFIDLLEDSRCPPNANCVWAGECSLTLKVNGKDNLTFGYPDDLHPTVVKYGNYKISITDVIYDKDDNFGLEKHCTVKLKVE